MKMEAICQYYGSSQQNSESFQFQLLFFVVGLHQCQIFVSPNHVPSFVTFLVWFGPQPYHRTERRTETTPNSRFVSFQPFLRPWLNINITKHRPL